MDKNPHPIIILKKKGGHSGHHGGAWKVAYADFVTAMMSLFIVLWLLNSSKPVQEAVGGYFRDPSGTAEKKGSIHVGTSENLVLTKDDMPGTAEGLRIELTESASGTFFDSGSPNLNADGCALLATLARELGKLPNKLSIEGHTDSKPYAASGNYGNWELS